MMHSRFVVLVLLAFLTAIPGGFAAEKLRVLMIGNSYTDMTRDEVRGMLAAGGKRDVELVAECPGGRTLAQHAANPNVEKLLTKRGGWSVIILQEQSQLPAFAMAGPPDGPMLKQLDQGAPVLIPKIRKAQPKARIILFETWARHRDPDAQQTLAQLRADPVKMQEWLTAGYQRIMKNPPDWDFSKSVTYAPVGQAFASWYAAKGYDKPEFKLHRDDNTHPNKAGAILTASVLYECITDRPATESKYTGNLTITGELKAQAHQTLAAKDRP